MIELMNAIPRKKTSSNKNNPLPSIKHTFTKRTENTKNSRG